MATTPTKRQRSPMALALRQTRMTMQLDQRQLGEMIGTSRGTINAWEVGKTVPPMEQRQRLLDALAATAPAAAHEALSRAFGFTPLRAGARGTTARDAAAARAGVTNVVRAAADDLDAVPSVVRKTLVAVARRMREDGITWEEVVAALAPEKRGG